MVSIFVIPVAYMCVCVWCVCVKVLVTQSCLTLFNHIECSSPGSSVHGIPFSRGSSQLRDQTRISCIGRRVLYYWATWEALYLIQKLSKLSTILASASLGIKIPTLAPPSENHPQTISRRHLEEFSGERDFSTLRKLGPCLCASALTEVLSYFALNFKQDRLLQPWYLRFDF